MTIAMTGASGFVGRALTKLLQSNGHSVRPVSTRTRPTATQFAGAHAVVHLAGEPIAQRWTDDAKRRIRESRVDATRALVEALRPAPPKVLVSASAIGIYGDRGDELLGEDASLPNDFVANVAKDWERQALKAREFGTRVVCPRIGIVLGAGGGALAKMLLPFKLGLGGRLGDGKQWMSWIALEDLCRMIQFAIEDDQVEGPINAVAPSPATNADFTRALGKALHRPAVFPVPAFGLRLAMGEMSQILLASARVSSAKVERLGFRFTHADLPSALKASLG